MVYSDIDDIQAQLTFILDTESKPTLTNAKKIQASMNRLVNGYIGARSDKTGAQAVSDLRVVEENLTIDAIMNIHEGRLPRPKSLLLQEFIILLDNHRSTSDVKTYDFYIGRDNLV